MEVLHAEGQKRTELEERYAGLMLEVAALRQEFAELKGIIKQQIDRTASLTMATFGLT